jgi:ribosomal protein S18 acetylase RimI-like enzyme
VHVRAWQRGYRSLMNNSWLDSLSVTDRQLQWNRRLIAGADYLSHPQDAPAEAELIPRSIAFLVALHPYDSHVCGFIGVGPVVPLNDKESNLSPISTLYAEITGLNVDPESWGSGASQALMSAALDAMRTSHYLYALLWVTEGNGRAITFYQREGFTFDGTRRGDQRDGHPFVALRMQRKL